MPVTIRETARETEDKPIMVQKQKNTKSNLKKTEYNQSRDGERDGLQLVQAVVLPLKRDIEFFLEQVMC